MIAHITPAYDLATLCDEQTPPTPAHLTNPKATTSRITDRSKPYTDRIPPIPDSVLNDSLPRPTRLDDSRQFVIDGVMMGDVWTGYDVVMQLTEHDSFMETRNGEASLRMTPIRVPPEQTRRAV